MENFESFDIFDTCLIRLCECPENIFEIMSKRLFDESQIHLQKAFVAERLREEQNAYKKFPNATVFQIYGLMDKNICSKTATELAELEMSVQEEMLVPNIQVLGLVNSARKSGKKIAFLSDMYLPSFFLEKILRKFGFFIDGDFLAVSCEWNASKCARTLYEKVIKKNHTSPSQWNHCGDNFLSDYLAPRNIGVSSRWYNEGGFSSDELKWLQESNFSPYKLDVAKFCGICRAARLSFPKDIKYELAVDLVAAVYVPYVYHVLLESRKNKVHRLYFIGRDGRIFLKIAEQFASQFKEIELRYIRFSRRAIYACSFYDASESELDWFFQCSRGQHLEGAISYLGLKWEELGPLWEKKFDKSLILSDENISAIMETLIKECGSLLKKRSFEKRKIFLRYLEQELCLDEIKKAFVDLGWGGSTRICINKILEKEGYSSVFFFYLGISEAYMVGNGKNETDVFQKQYFVKSNVSILLLEHYASMNCDGSVLSYEYKNDIIVPVEAKKLNKNNPLIQINELAVSLVAQLYSKLNLTSEANYNVFLCCGLRKLNLIEYFPSKDEFDLISQLQAEDYGFVSSLVKKYSFKDILALFIWGVPSRTYWDAGARIKTFGKYHVLFKRFFEKTSSSAICVKLRTWWDHRK